MFIVLEGIDGSGKTTIAKQLVEILKTKNITSIYTREPGGLNLKFAESIRSLIFEHKNLSPLTLTLLFLASRIEHINQIIIPNLQKNKYVICDRFYYSSIVYQGILQNVGNDFVLNLNKNALMKVSEKLWKPDYVFFIQTDYKVAKSRKANSLDQNYFDDFSLEDYNKLNIAYKNVFQQIKSDQNIYYIDGNKNINDILNSILKIIFNDK